MLIFCSHTPCQACSPCFINLCRIVQLFDLFQSIANCVYVLRAMGKRPSATQSHNSSHPSLYIAGVCRVHTSAGHRGSGQPWHQLRCGHTHAQEAGHLRVRPMPSFPRHTGGATMSTTTPMPHWNQPPARPQVPAHLMPAICANQQHCGVALRSATQMEPVGNR